MAIAICLFPYDYPVNPRGKAEFSLSLRGNADIITKIYAFQDSSYKKEEVHWAFWKVFAARLT